MVIYMKKITTEEFIERLHIANPLIEVQADYVNQRTKVKVKGTECGHIWEARPYDLLKGHGCPQCRYKNNSQKSRYTNEVFLKKIEKINPNIELLDKYITSQTPILVRCTICQHTWKVKPNTLLNGSGCASCAGLKKKTTDEFISELKKRNSTIEVLGNYISNRHRIHVKCGNCGFEWAPTAKSLLDGRGCPECTKAGTSFMEQFILAAFQLALGKDSVINRDRRTLGTELDIYLPELSLAIEPGSWFWHKNLVNEDLEKRKKGAEKHIRVITIYDTFPSDETPPFDIDCFVYAGQLNEPGYFRLKELTLILFGIANIVLQPTEDFWNNVINHAHKNTSRITHSEFVKTISTISPTIEIIGKYRSNREKLEVKCISCGYQWEAIPASLLRGSGCVVCAGLKRLTTDEFIAKLSSISPQIEVLGEYANTSTKIQVRDNLCGHEWSASPNSLMRGSGCPICARNTRKSTEQFIEEMQTINPSIRIIGEYINARTKIAVFCTECGRNFSITPNSLMNGHGCKECNLIKGNRKRKVRTP